MHKIEFSRTFGRHRLHTAHATDFARSDVVCLCVCVLDNVSVNVNRGFI